MSCSWGEKRQTGSVLQIFRVSLPTKIVEYCGLGVPVITTPLPIAANLVRSENIGFEVPWNDSNAVVDAILRLRAEPELRSQLGANGHRMALRDHDWNRLSVDFVRVMEAYANGQTPTRPSLVRRQHPTSSISV